MSKYWYKYYVRLCKYLLIYIYIVYHCVVGWCSLTNWDAASKSVRFWGELSGDELAEEEEELPAALLQVGGGKWRDSSLVMWFLYGFIWYNRDNLGRMLREYWDPDCPLVNYQNYGNHHFYWMINYKWQFSSSQYQKVMSWGWASTTPSSERPPWSSGVSSWNLQCGGFQSHGATPNS